MGQVCPFRFIEKEDTIVGEADFTRHGVTAATDEGDWRDGVVRAAEGTHGHQRGALREFSRHAVYLGRLEGLTERERRHDGRQALGHHRFARSRATHEQDVVSSSAGYLKGALDVLLALDVGKVIGEDALGLGKLGAGVHDGGLQLDFAIEELHDLDEVVHTVDVEFVDHGRFKGIGPRHDETVQVEFTRQYRHGQGTLDGPQAAIKREFAHEHESLEPVGGYFLVASQDADGERQVIGRAFLLDVGR